MAYSRKKKSNFSKVASAVIALILAIIALFGKDYLIPDANNGPVDINSIPAYAGKAYVEVNGNVPYFTEDEYTTKAYENYSELDSLGRCGVVMACLGKETMPAKDEDRESINNVTPSGWVQKKYSADLVSGGWLYNRCHLIGWQLSAENDNERNLITGTRYFNAGNSEEQGMLLFENMVADYIKETGNHVLYRVTPVYDGNNLVANGILMEAFSMEDNGEGICFNVYFYNVQPGITINYATGESWITE